MLPSLHIQETLEEWLALLGLAEYSPSLRRQGYRTVEDVTQLTWEDLEDFGILRLGHQKKIMLAIKRVKDILTGKYMPVHMLPNESMTSPGGEVHEVSLTTFQYRNGSSTTSSSSHYAIPPSIMRPVFFPQQQQQPPSQQHYHHYQQHHMQQQQQQQQQPIYYHYQQPTYRPDVVAIQVRFLNKKQFTRGENNNKLWSHHRFIGINLLKIYELVNKAMLSLTLLISPNRLLSNRRSTSPAGGRGVTKTVTWRQ